MLVLKMDWRNWANLQSVFRVLQSRPFILLALVLLATAAQAQIKTPATFDGLIPCADCMGIRVTLTLRDDGIFLLRRTYLRGPSPISGYDLGRWSLSGRKLQLMAGKSVTEQYALRKSGDLVMLDREGKEIQSKLNFTLSREARVDPLQDTMPLQGLYSYIADAGWFEECRTGKRFPVGPSLQNARLESEYGKVRKKPAQAVLVSILGHFAMKPKLTLIVDAFEHFTPNATCQAR